MSKELLNKYKHLIGDRKFNNKFELYYFILSTVDKLTPELEFFRSILKDNKHLQEVRND